MNQEPGMNEEEKAPMRDNFDLFQFAVDKTDRDHLCRFSSTYVEAKQPAN